MENIEHKDILNDSDVLEKIKGFERLLSEMKDSGEITQEQKDRFIKEWLGEDPSSITEEGRGEVDKYIIDSLRTYSMLNTQREDLKKALIDHIIEVKRQLRSGELPLNVFSDNEVSSTPDVETQLTQEIIDENDGVDEIDIDTINNEYELAEILNRKISEIKSIIKDYSINIELKDTDENSQENLEILRDAIRRVNSDILRQELGIYEPRINTDFSFEDYEAIKARENASEIEADETSLDDDEVEEDDSDDDETIDVDEVEVEEDDSDDDETIDVDEVEVEEDDSDDDETIDKELNIALEEISDSENQDFDIYSVKKGDNLWSIVREKYNFRKRGDNQKIVDKIAEVIAFQDEGAMKNRLISSNGDTIWAGDNIKLPK